MPAEIGQGRRKRTASISANNCVLSPISPSATTIVETASASTDDDVASACWRKGAELGTAIVAARPASRGPGGAGDASKRESTLEADTRTNALQRQFKEAEAGREARPLVRLPLPFPAGQLGRSAGRWDNVGPNEKVARRKRRIGDGTSPMASAG